MVVLRESDTGSAKMPKIYSIRATVLVPTIGVWLGHTVSNATVAVHRTFYEILVGIEILPCMHGIVETTYFVRVLPGRRLN